MTDSTPASSAPSYSSSDNSAPQTSGGKGKSLTALILGIVSIVTSLLWFISGPAGLVGLILGVMGRKSEPSGRGLAMGGIITSVIGLILTIVWVVVGLVVGNALQNGDITIPSPS